MDTADEFGSAAAVHCPKAGAQSSPELYYRLEDYQQATGGWDMQGEWEPGPSRVQIRTRTFPVLKHTPKGVWIQDHGDHRGKRFISNTWVKRYALPTEEEAKISFIKRKERQASIYEARAKIAHRAIALLLDLDNLTRMLNS